MTKHKTPTNNNQQGFTIVELMIATAIFSIVLLILTFGVLQITNSYYRGVTESNTQNTARNIINAVSQSIQFGGDSFASAGTPNAGAVYCIGSQRYSYITGKELEDNPKNSDQVTHVLVVDNPSGCSANNSGLNSGGQELLGQNMRLAAFTVAQVGTSSLYKIDVRVLYGDVDLLTATTGPSATCNTGSGSQFCAVSELSTIVQKRVQ